MLQNIYILTIRSSFELSIHQMYHGFYKNMKHNNNDKCFLSKSEHGGSCDTEDWRNDAENSA